ncbi:MAG: acyl-CoA oxidase, partial [Myxococcaceae bacterium]|nr:acyl-CoA oxidase [Myxococcaceae bacterium]
LAETYAFHFGLEAVRDRFLARGRDDDGRELEAEVAGIKAGATWHVTRTLQACREACGGQGYLSVNRIADARADTDIFTTFEGDNTVLMQLLAKGLLTGFKRRFAEQGPLRFVAGQLKAQVALTNPFTKRAGAEDALRDAAHQQELLDWREASLLQSAAKRVQKRLKAQDGAALNEVQEHLLSLAEAHVDATTLRAFADAVARTEGAERDVLDRLRTLHGLQLLERHSTWFYENGVFEPARGRAVRRLVPTLFAELVPDVLGLTAAFGIPEACLAAPIAFSDPAHPRW